MKTYFSKIIPRLEKYSKELDEKALLVNEHWVVYDEESDQRLVYIFRKNNELIISRNGKVEKGSWEYLGNNSLLIDRSENSFLCNHGFLNEKVMALKVDGKSEYAILLNDQKIQNHISSLEDVYKLLEEDGNQSYLSTKSNISQTPSEDNDTKKIESSDSLDAHDEKHNEDEFPKIIECPKCDTELQVSKKAFENRESYCSNCHEDIRIPIRNKRKEELEKDKQISPAQIEAKSNNKTSKDFHKQLTSNEKSDQENLLFPKKLSCPICEDKVQLK